MSTSKESETIPLNESNKSYGTDDDEEVEVLAKRKSRTIMDSSSPEDRFEEWMLDNDIEVCNDSGEKVPWNKRCYGYINFENKK